MGPRYESITTRLKLLIQEVLQEEFNNEIANALNMKSTNKMPNQQDPAVQVKFDEGVLAATSEIK